MSKTTMKVKKNIFSEEPDPPKDPNPPPSPSSYWRRMVNYLKLRVGLKTRGTVSVTSNVLTKTNLSR